MRVYVEPIVFYLNFTRDEYSVVPRKIFGKAEEEKIKLFTSIWTIPQFIGAINELYVTRQIGEQTKMNLIMDFKILETKLGDSLTKVYPVEQLMNTCISYIIERNVDYERAWHLATAKLSQCDTYVTVDKNLDIDKKIWKKEFEVYNMIDENDTRSFAEKLNKA